MKAIIMLSANLLLIFSLNGIAVDYETRGSRQVYDESKLHIMKIRFESSPMGASVYLDERKLGVCPFTTNTTLGHKEYLEASKSMGKFTARWASGAIKEKEIRFDASKSWQIAVFSRPYGVSGWDTDVKFAVELEKLRLAQDQFDQDASIQRQRLSLQKGKAEADTSIQQQALALQREQAEAEASIQRQRLELQKEQAEAEAKIQQQRLELQREQAYAEASIQQQRLDEQKRQAREAERQWEKEQTAEAVNGLVDQMNRISDGFERSAQRRRNTPVRQYGTGSGYQRYGY